VRAAAAPLVFDGWIRSGKWMRGYVSIHGYLTRCALFRLKGWLQ
jgi:hypothetical protein